MQAGSVKYSLPSSSCIWLEVISTISVLKGSESSLAVLRAAVPRPEAGPADTHIISFLGLQDKSLPASKEDSTLLSLGLSTEHELICTMGYLSFSAKRHVKNLSELFACGNKVRLGRELALPIDSKLLVLDMFLTIYLPVSFRS